MSVACTLEECKDEDCVQLTEREFSVCSVICLSREPVPFAKLREKTQLHQEVVSRIVRRLAIHGLVEKTDSGYLGKCGQ